MKRDITFIDIEKAVTVINDYYDSNNLYMFPRELVSNGTITNDNLMPLISRLEGLGLIQLVPNQYGDKYIKRLDACKSFLLTRAELRADIEKANKRSTAALIVSIVGVSISLLSTLALYLSLIAQLTQLTQNCL